jgi:hypothetical protein
MTLAPNQWPDVDTLAAVIAHSQIVVARILVKSSHSSRLPEGFEAADLAILDWIAAEGRRGRRAFVWM